MILKAIKEQLTQKAQRKIPLYLRISQAIAQVIRTENIGENEALPSERDLAGFLDVSRITIRKAIENLEQKNLVMRIHGRGTFVRKPIQQNLQALSGFTEEFGEKNAKLHQKWLMRKIMPATKEEALALNIPALGKVSHLKRIRYINHMPLAIEHAAIPCDILDDPHKIQHSLYQFFKEAGYKPVHALQHISAQNCSPQDAALLKIAPHEAVLHIKRRTYDPKKRIIEFVRSLYRSDLYELIAELHLKP